MSQSTLEKSVVGMANRPADVLGKTPEVKSEADANRALRELAFLAAYRKSFEAMRDEELANVLERFEEMQAIPFGRETMTLEERGQVLTAALETFVEAEFSDLKQNKAKRSVKLTHGTIGWVKSRAAIGFLKGKDAKSVLEKIDQQCEKMCGKKLGGLINQLVRTIAMLPLFRQGREVSVVASDLVDVKASLNRTKVRDAFLNQRLTREQLKQFGLKYVAGADQFQAKPSEFQTDI